MRWTTLLICLSLFVGRAQAQAAPPFVQSGLDAIFLVDKDTTTAMYSFSYVEPTSATIRWVLPLPPGSSPPKLDSSALSLFTQFQTEPFIEPPRHEDQCHLSVSMSVSDGYLPTPDYFPPRQESSVQVSTLANDTVAFVTANGQTVSAVERAALTHYAARGYQFAMLTISSDIPTAPAYSNTSINVHLSPTVVVTYPGSEPILPLAFHADAVATHLDNYDEADFMPVTVHIFAQMPYAPAGTAAFVPDISRIEGAKNQLANTMQLDEDPIFFNQLDPQYYQLVHEGIAQRGGEAFVREFVGSPPKIDWSPWIPGTGPTKPAVNQLIADYPVVTRLRTFLRVDQHPDDAIFVPDPGAPAFSLNLEENGNDAWFYGCTSRKLYDSTLEARLPAGRAHIDALHLSLARPTGWTLSTIDHAGAPIYVLSPEAVTGEMLLAMESGRGGSPMIVAQGIYQNWDYQLHDPTWDSFMRSDNRRSPTVASCAAMTFYLPSPNAVPWADVTPTQPIRRVHLAVLTSPEDCTANKVLYSEMLTYASSYQYFLSADLRNTEFVGELYNLSAIAYPEGWNERYDAEGSLLMLPQGADYADSPAVRVLSHWPHDDATFRLLYNLPNDYDPTPGTMTSFEANGRRGYLLWTYNILVPVIEISTPSNRFDSDDPLLRQMRDATWIVKPSG